MIKIDMEMPRNCPNCPLMIFVPWGITYKKSNSGAYCRAGEFFIALEAGRRFPDNCPMQEVADDKGGAQQDIRGSM